MHRLRSIVASSSVCLHVSDNAHLPIRRPKLGVAVELLALWKHRLRQNLYHRMMRSWLKAMGFAADDPRFGQLVNVSENPVNEVPWSGILNLNDWCAMDEAMYIASYLCKTYSKPVSQGIHVFDSSRR